MNSFTIPFAVTVAYNLGRGIQRTSRDTNIPVSDVREYFAVLKVHSQSARCAAAQQCKLRVLPVWVPKSNKAQRRLSLLMQVTSASNPDQANLRLRTLETHAKREMALVMPVASKQPTELRPEVQARVLAERKRERSELRDLRRKTRREQIGASLG